MIAAANQAGAEEVPQKLEDFVADVRKKDRLTLKERQRIVDQALILFEQKDRHRRPPIVIGRHGSVEAKHIAAGADPGGRILKLWEMRIEQRPHDLFVEAAAQFQAGHKRDAYWI